MGVEAEGLWLFLVGLLAVAGDRHEADGVVEFSLGIHLRTPRVQIYENSDVMVNRGSAVAGAMPVLSALAVAPSTRNAGLDLLRAGRAGIAVAYQYAVGWIAVELDFQPGLHRPELEVDRNALVNSRFGVYHAILPSVAIGAGLFTDRASDTVRRSLLSGSGDFYGASLGVELTSEHRLAQSEPVDSLIFSTVFALRYAYSKGDFGRAVANPAAIAASGDPFVEAPGTLRVHEIGFYVGSGLHF